MPRLAVILATALLGLTAADPAVAYFGPGAGITMLTALWGVILAVLLAVGAILVWPVRALLRRRRHTAPGERVERSQTG
jgi:type VI protein secretion system component VasK